MTGFARLRKSAGLKQRQAADILGLSRTTIAKWETGISFPRFQMLPAIAEAYQCTLDELIHCIHETEQSD